MNCLCRMSSESWSSGKCCLKQPTFNTSHPRSTSLPFHNWKACHWPNLRLQLSLKRRWVTSYFKRHTMGFFSACNECWKGNVLLVPTILASYSPKIWIRYTAKKFFKARQILAAFNKGPERHQLQSSWGLQYDHCFVRRESCLNVWQFCVSWVLRQLESGGGGNEGKDRAGCLVSEALTRRLNLLSQGLSQANVTGQTWGRGVEVVSGMQSCCGHLMDKLLAL